MSTDPQPEPPVKPKRRRWQYGLGTMLACLTTLCVWLAILRSSAEKQTLAVMAITRRGGHVEYAQPDSVFARAAGLCLDRDWVSNVVSVNLAGTFANDSDLANLRSFPNIQILRLDGTKVSDAGIVHLLGLKQLRSLYLDGTRITDRGVATVARMQSLDTLSLTFTAVTNRGAVELSGASGLRHLNVQFTRVTDAGVRSLQQKHRPSWQTLPSWAASGGLRVER